MLRAGSGRDWKLVLGCTRADAFATHRYGAVTVVIDVIDVALVNSIAPASSGVQQSGLVQAPIDNDSEDARWRNWKQKGRVDDARFRRNLRTVLVDVAGVAALGGAVWFAVGIWL